MEDAFNFQHDDFAAPSPKKIKTEESNGESTCSAGIAPPPPALKPVNEEPGDKEGADLQVAVPATRARRGRARDKDPAVPMPERPNPEGRPSRGSITPANATGCPIPLCLDCIVGKKRFCPKHTRAQNILRDRVWAVCDIEDESTYDDEAQGYCDVFGRKAIKKAKLPALPGDLEKAGEVLDAVLAVSPDLGGSTTDANGKKVRNTKTQTARGTTIKLSNYRAQEGTTYGQEDFRSRPKWDKALFQYQMKYLRGWDFARSDREWNTIELETPDIYKTMTGPFEAPLVLPIPCWYAGTTALNDSVKNFRTKMLESASDKMKLSREEKSRIVAECRTGFGPIAHADRLAAMASTAQGSITAEDEDIADAAQMLVEMKRQGNATAQQDNGSETGAPAPAPTNSTGSGSGRENQTPAAQTPNKGGQKSSGNLSPDGSGQPEPTDCRTSPTNPASTPQPTKKTDVIVVRASTLREKKAMLVAEEFKVWKAIEASHDSLKLGSASGLSNDETYRTLKDRHDLLLAYMGCSFNADQPRGKRVMDIGYDGAKQPYEKCGEDGPPPALPQHLKTLGAYGTHVLREKLENHKLLPIDQPLDMLCNQELHEFVQEFSTAETGYDIEALSFAVDESKARVVQLRECLSQTSADAKKYFTKQARIVKATKAAEDSKRQAAMKEQEDLQVKRLKKDIANRQLVETGIFGNGVLEASSLLKTPTYPSLEKVQAARSDCKMDVTQPCVVDFGSEIAAGMSRDRNLRDSYGRWQKSWLGALDSSCKSSTRAPLIGPHGAQAATSLMNLAADSFEPMDVSAFPMLSRASMPWWWAIKTGNILTGFENHHFGGVRLVLSGDVKVLVFKGSSILTVAGYLKEADIPKSMTLAEVVASYVLNMGKEECRKFSSAGHRAWEAELGPNSALVVPAGCYTCVLACSKADGMQASFLPMQSIREVEFVEKLVDVKAALVLLKAQGKGCTGSMKPGIIEGGRKEEGANQKGDDMTDASTSSNGTAQKTEGEKKDGKGEQKEKTEGEKKDGEEEPKEHRQTGDEAPGKGAEKEEGTKQGGEETIEASKGSKGTAQKTEGEKKDGEDEPQENGKTGEEPRTGDKKEEGAKQVGEETKEASEGSKGTAQKTEGEKKDGEEEPKENGQTGEELRKGDEKEEGAKQVGQATNDASEGSKGTAQKTEGEKKEGEEEDEKEGQQMDKAPFLN